MSAAGFPRRHPDTAFRQIKDEGGLVVCSSKGEVKVMNPVGIKIFSMLDGAHSEDDIVDAVVDEFDVTKDTARGDVQAFLQVLQEHGILAVETNA